MKWDYQGASDQDGVKFHIWSALDENGLEVFALTRTSVLAPQRPVIYRSVEELIRRNRFQTGGARQPEPVLTTIPEPPDPSKPHGLYRRPGGWVEVNMLHSTTPMPRGLYEKSGYWPAYDQLPSLDDYIAVKGSISESNRP